LPAVGARPGDRDSVDVKIIDAVKYRSGNYINCVDLDSSNPKCDSQIEVAGGWPTLDENTITLDIPTNPHGDDDSDGYTNLEEWAHRLGDKVTSSLSNPQNHELKDYKSGS